MVFTSDLVYCAMYYPFSRPLLTEKVIAKIKAKRARLIREHETEQLSLHTSDGLLLSGLLVKRKNAKYAVLACHGYHLGKESMFHCLDLFPDAHVLFFDFRAHGESEGTLTSLGYYEKKDVKAVVDYLRTNTETAHLPLIGIGFCMGAASLLSALSDTVVLDAVILDSCFSDLKEQWRSHLRKHYSLFLSLFSPVMHYVLFLFAGVDVGSVSPREWIKDIEIPFLIIHSRDDEIISDQAAYDLYEHAKQVQLWVVDGSKHGKIWKEYQDSYKEKVFRFVSKNITFS